MIISLHNNIIILELIQTIACTINIKMTLLGWISLFSKQTQLSSQQFRIYSIIVMFSDQLLSWNLLGLAFYNSNFIVIISINWGSKHFPKQLCG